MRSAYVYIKDRYKQMPVSIHWLIIACVFAPIFALGLYIRNDPPVHYGLSRVLLIAVGCALYIYGFLQATKWSRPLLVLWFVAGSIWGIIRDHATYSALDFLGLLLIDGFMVWLLYFRRDVREYYARAGKSVS